MCYPILNALLLEPEWPISAYTNLRQRVLYYITLCLRTCGSYNMALYLPNRLTVRKEGNGEVSLLLTVNLCLPVADPGFSGGGAGNSQSWIIFSTFCRKVHENKRIWTPGVSLAPPLDPSMFTVPCTILTEHMTGYMRSDTIPPSVPRRKTLM